MAQPWSRATNPARIHPAEAPDHRPRDVDVMGKTRGHSRRRLGTRRLGVSVRKCGPQDSNLQPRDSRPLAFPRGLDYLTLPVLLREIGRPGARRRGLLLGLTPLVSEPSWPPGPSQAWLRIAMRRGSSLHHPGV